MALIDPAFHRELQAYAAKLGPEMVRYYKYQDQRFAFEAELLTRYLNAFPPGRKIRFLDVGPSFQTIILSRLWGERAHIDTFGFADPKFPPPQGGRHIAFDLNDAYYPERWPRMEPYDMVGMFAVIEHLYTSPVQVLRFLSSLVVSGGIIVVSTPNAVTLPNRIRFLLGRNPFERIRETRDDPGHYRESTRREMREIGEAAGLIVKEEIVLNLSLSGSPLSKIYKMVSPILPKDLRKELTMVYQKP
jgi:hypothetical protein